MLVCIMITAITIVLMLAGILMVLASRNWGGIVLGVAVIAICIASFETIEHIERSFTQIDTEQKSNVNQ